MRDVVGCARRCQAVQTLKARPSASASALTVRPYEVPGAPWPPSHQQPQNQLRAKRASLEPCMLLGCGMAGTLQPAVLPAPHRSTRWMFLVDANSRPSGATRRRSTATVLVHPELSFSSEMYT